MQNTDGQHNIIEDNPPVIQVVYEDENTILISLLDEDVFNEVDYSISFRKSMNANVIRADVLFWHQILWLKNQLKKGVTTVIDPNYDAPIQLSDYIKESLECLKK